MREHLQVQTKTEVILADYYVVRVINETNSKKTVIREVEFPSEPTAPQIAEIILNTKGASFASVEHNYRVETPMPF